MSSRSGTQGRHGRFWCSGGDSVSHGSLASSASEPPILFNLHWTATGLPILSHCFIASTLFPSSPISAAAAADVARSTEVVVAETILSSVGVALSKDTLADIASLHGLVRAPTPSVLHTDEMASREHWRSVGLPCLILRSNATLDRSNHGDRERSYCGPGKAACWNSRPSPSFGKLKFGVLLPI
jgi:hypothetical protein